MWAWSSAFEQILRDGSFNLISIFASIAMEVCRIDVQVWSLQPIILLIMIDNIGYVFLLVEAALVDCVFGEVWLDNV